MRISLPFYTSYTNGDEIAYEVKGEGSDENLTLEGWMTESLYLIIYTKAKNKLKKILISLIELKILIFHRISDYIFYVPLHTFSF